jgi:hypothetical protein
MSTPACEPSAIHTISRSTSPKQPNGRSHEKRTSSRRHAMLSSEPLWRSSRALLLLWRPRPRPNQHVRAYVPELCYCLRIADVTLVGALFIKGQEITMSRLRLSNVPMLVVFLACTIAAVSIKAERQAMAAKQQDMSSVKVSSDVVPDSCPVTKPLRQYVPPSPYPQRLRLETPFGLGQIIYGQISPSMERGKDCSTISLAIRRSDRSCSCGDNSTTCTPNPSPS